MAKQKSDMRDVTVIRNKGDTREKTLAAATVPSSIDRRARQANDDKKVVSIGRLLQHICLLGFDTKKKKKDHERGERRRRWR